MERTLSDNLFQQFSRLVYEQCGINLHEGKKALLQARLNKRMRTAGFTQYDEYFKFIENGAHADEMVRFLDCISTNLTYFFREPQHFDFLDRIYLPELLAAKTKGHVNRLRFWSAGCSTGEEPYSLAMCTLPHLRDGRKWDFRILATDISTRVLEVAVRGVYPMEKIVKVPEALQKTCFNKVSSSEETFQVAPQVKSVISFRRLNLMEPYPFKGPFDVIFCRNVMIYFDKVTQEELIRKFANYLGPRGHLFVGHSESLAGLRHSLTSVRPAVYRK